MRKGIQPALEQYLVTAGGGEGATVAAAAAASMDKRALLASPGFAAAAAAAAAPGAYIQILTSNTSTTSCSSSLHSGAVAAGPHLPSVPGAEQTAGSLLYTTPHGPSSRAGLLQQPPALGRGGSSGGGPPVMPSGSQRPQPRRRVGALPRESAGRIPWASGLPLQRGFIVRLVRSPQRPWGWGTPPGARGSGDRLGANHIKHSETFRAPPFFSCTFPYPHSPLPSNSKLPLSPA